MSMFAMPQHQYVYAPQVPTSRQYSTDHGTSSAFSPSANPDEDWTKIPDLAMRRRIQNRIAQRNYRKKLKRKLEELERRAGDGTSGSEKQGPTQTKNKKQGSQKSQKPAPGPKPLQPGQYTPPPQHDELLLMSSYDGRERSHTPPIFHYPQYPPPDALSVVQYGTPQPYSTSTATEAYPAYLTTTADPVTLPPMTHCDTIKRNGYDSGDSLTPYMNYGYIPDIDVSSPHHYENSNPQTPPLSHSFDHSANCSDSGYEYPATPLSMPGSPGMTQQH